MLQSRMHWFTDKELTASLEYVLSFLKRIQLTCTAWVRFALEEAVRSRGGEYV
jgi:hypothetical protein